MQTFRFHCVVVGPIKGVLSFGGVLHYKMYFKCFPRAEEVAVIKMWLY